MKKVKFVLVVVVLLVSQNLLAEKMRIAVLDLKSDGVPDRTGRTVSDMIRTDMVNTGKFNVIERTQMDAIMNEQGLQMTGCTDQECAVQIGKVMSARKILVGSVSPLGQAIVINVRIVDVEKGLVEYAAREKADAESTLDKAASSLTKKLSSKIEGEGFFSRFSLMPEHEQPKAKEEKKEDKKKVKAKEKKVLQETTMTGYYLRSIVPGWGQFYVGKTSKGYAFLVAFAVSAAYSTWALLDYGKKKKDYDSLPFGTQKSEFDSKYDSYQKAGNTMLVSFGILGAVYIAHWVDILYFSKPDSGMFKNTGAMEGEVFVNLYADAGSVMLPERRTILAVTMRY